MPWRVVSKLFEHLAIGLVAGACIEANGSNRSMKNAMLNALASEPFFAQSQKFPSDPASSVRRSYVHLVNVAAPIVFAESEDGIRRQDVTTT